MAKSRRARQADLTKVKKRKGLAVKEKLVDAIRDRIRSSRYCYVVELNHCKTRLLQLFREKLKTDCEGSNLIMTKNRLVQVALGVDRESALEENIYKLSGLLEGTRALVIGNLNRESLLRTFDQAQAAYVEESGLKGADRSSVPAHAGDVATETVVVPNGLLENVPFSQESLLRKLGMPTKLDNAKVYVLGDFTICTEGEVLTKDRAHLLRLLGFNQAQPSLACKGMYDRNKQSVKVF